MAVAEVPLVARDRELELLLGAVRAAGAGQPSGWLVAADAGVGKTRLLSEVLTRAVAEGALPLVGHCVDLGAGALPYLPFAEALGHLQQAQNDGPQAGSDQMAELLRVHPAAQRLALRGGAAGTVDSGASDDRLPLFEAAHALLTQVGAAGGPVVLVLEDLHWADQSSRDLLRFLLARQRDERVVIIGSYRADDLHRRHPLRSLLAELVRLPSVERLDLAPFGIAEMREYLAALHGSPVPEEVVTRILDRSGGNAYFAEQLLAAGATAGATALPGALADVLLGRLEQLPTAVQQLARVASVAGRQVTDSVLAAATGWPVDEVDAALRDAVAHHVLSPDADGYVFRHALLQEAVYADLLPREQVRLHATYARLLAAESGGEQRGRSAALARHSLASHDLAGALRASIGAAAEAEKMLAPAEALTHLELALRLWDAVPDAAGVAGQDHTLVALHAASAAARAGELHRGVALAESARDLADESGDLAQRALTRQKLAFYLYNADMDAKAGTVAQQALDLLKGQPPSAPSVWAAAIAARSAASAGELARSREMCRASLAEARELHMHDAEADLLTTLAVLDDMAGEPDVAEEHLRKAYQRAVSSRDRLTELRAGYNLAANRFYRGQIPQALEHLKRDVAAAETAGLTWSAYGIELRMLQVIALYVDGDFSGSLAAAQRLVGARPPDVIMARLSAAALYAEVAAGLPEARRRVGELAAYWYRDGQIGLVAGGCEADLQVWQSDQAGAVRTIEKALEALAHTWPDYQLGGIWLAAIGIGALADLASEARLRRDDAALSNARERAAELLAKATALAEEGRPRGGGLGPEGVAWLRRAEAEHSRLAERPSPNAWREAVAAFGFGYHYEVARCQWRLAEALLLEQQTAGADEVTRHDELLAEAGDLAAAARETAIRLGAGPLRSAVEALMRRASLPGAQATGARAAAGPFTAREREVMTLLARGLTNRQIGSELFISEKTASVHVSNILAKLGASSRTEAVSVAHQRGLLPTQRAAQAGAGSR